MEKTVCSGCGVTPTDTDPLVVIDGVEVYAGCCKDHPVRGPAPVSRGPSHVMCFLIVHSAVADASAMAIGTDKYEHTRTEDICWDCIEAESESNPHRFPKRRQLPEHREP